ncbi:MAG TPA: ABC transporter permease [Acidobacteriota bacterium]|nr:ABC transporter permease [Acidobacteriota bacterium]
MEDFWSDVKVAVRRLAGRPVFLVVCLLTLALGIGANTMIFGVIYNVLLRPLPFPQPERIVQMVEERPGSPEGRIAGFSLDSFREWREVDTVFSSMAAFQNHTATLDDRQPAQELNGVRATVGFFEVLGVPAALGTAFEPVHEERGNERVVVLSHAAWQTYFGGDRQAVGRSMSLDGIPYTVIGVMPPDFAFPDRDAEYWIPMLLGPVQRSARERRVIAMPVFARLAPGVSLQQAQAEGRALVEELRRRDPDLQERGRRVVLHLETLHQQITGPVRTPLYVLFAAVGLLLLIACTNVANLLLARGAERQGEIAVRIALGAGGGRLTRLVLTESVLLALLGGGAGLIVALGGIRLLQAFGADLIPRVDSVSLDWTVLAFALALSTVTGLIFGLIPALQYRRLDLTSSLKESSEQGPVGGLGPLLGIANLRGGLVVVQIALAAVLLVGAALLASSFVRLSNVDPGYDWRNVATMRIQLPGYRYGSAQSRSDFLDALLEQVRAMPGAEAAGVANLLPMAQARIQLSFGIRGRPEFREEGRSPQASIRVITPGYFQAMSTEILQGRDFRDSDRPGTPPVLIVNQALVDRYFPDENPIGQEIQFGEIVGVTENILNEGLNTRPQPEFYFPLQQLPSGMSMLLRQAHLVVKTSRPPEQLVPFLHGAVQSLDPALPQFDVTLLEERVDREIAEPRLYSGLMSAFSGLALILAMIGLYGVTSYAVARRTRETGIRMALGADSVRILKLVLRQGLVLALVGILTGMAVALALSRLLDSLLFEVSPTDPWTYITVPLVLLLVMLAATYLPARRASRLDPWKALRVT